MMNVVSIPQKIFILVLALMASPTSFAIVNPESGRKSAPVVLKCLVLSTSQRDEGGVTTYTVNCKPLEKLLAPKSLQLPDPVIIHYSVDHATLEQQAMNQRRMAAEKPGYAGPGLDLPPKLPVRNQVILAYLRPVEVSPNKTIFVPASGSASFEYPSEDQVADAQNAIHPGEIEQWENDFITYGCGGGIAASYNSTTVYRRDGRFNRRSYSYSQDIKDVTRELEPDIELAQRVFDSLDLNELERINGVQEPAPYSCFLKAKIFGKDYSAEWGGGKTKPSERLMKQLQQIRTGGRVEDQTNPNQ